MTDPVEHYYKHQSVYDMISEQVEATAETFASVDRSLQRDLLERAVSFALISAQTPVHIHEQGYLQTVGTEIEADTRELLRDAGVNYYNNKASYMAHNSVEADFDRIMDAYDDGDMDRMHRAIADECKGVGLRKAGFAMALVVTPEKMCLDTNVCQQANIEPDDIYNGVVVERYENQCQQVKEKYPELNERLSSFMVQWVVFDSNRGGVTTHDPWFLSLPEECNISAPGVA